MKNRPSTQSELLSNILNLINSQPESPSFSQISHQLRPLLLEFASETDDNVRCLEYIEYGKSPNPQAHFQSAGFKLKDKNIFLSDIMNALEDLETPPESVKNALPALTAEEWEAATRLMTVLLLLLEKPLKTVRPT